MEKERIILACFAIIMLLLSLLIMNLRSSQTNTQDIVIGRGIVSSDFLKRSPTPICSEKVFGRFIEKSC